MDGMLGGPARNPACRYFGESDGAVPPLSSGPAGSHAQSLPVGRRLAVAGLLGGAASMSARQGAAEEQPPKLTLYEPKLSPDGRTILFAFRYGGLNPKLAMMSSDPASPWLRILEAPPTMEWAQPAWAPDGRSFVAVSYCTHDRCHQGAQGIHVWRFGLLRRGDRTGGLDRVSPAGTGVWRIRPFFGPTASDLCWVVRSTVLYPGTSAGLRDHFLTRTGGGDREDVFFPSDRTVLRNGDFVSDGFQMYNVHPASHFDGRVLFFTANVAGGTLPAARRTLNWMGRSNHRTQLFRWDAGGVQLLRDEEIFRVDVPPSGGGHMTMTRRPVSGLHPTDFDLFRSDGRPPERRLVFGRGFVSEFSVSDGFDALVFLGDRQFAFGGGGELSYWVHRPGMPEAVDLLAPERLRAEVARQIKRERRE